MFKTIRIHAAAILQFLWETARLLKRSILGEPTTTTNCSDGIKSSSDPMQIIPGYWDPRQLRFIEWAEPGEKAFSVDRLELSTVGGSRATGGGVGDARPGTATSCGKN